MNVAKYTKPKDTTQANRKRPTQCKPQTKPNMPRYATAVQLGRGGATERPFPNIPIETPTLDFKSGADTQPHQHLPTQPLFNHTPSTLATKTPTTQRKPIQRKSSAEKETLFATETLQPRVSIEQASSKAVQRQRPIIQRSIVENDGHTPINPVKAMKRLIAFGLTQNEARQLCNYASGMGHHTIFSLVRHHRTQNQNGGATRVLLQELGNNAPNLQNANTTTPSIGDVYRQFESVLAQLPDPDTRETPPTLLKQNYEIMGNDLQSSIKQFDKGSLIPLSSSHPKMGSGLQNAIKQFDDRTLKPPTHKRMGRALQDQIANFQFPSNEQEIGSDNSEDHSVSTTVDDNSIQEETVEPLVDENLNKEKFRQGMKFGLRAFDGAIEQLKIYKQQREIAQKKALAMEAIRQVNHPEEKKKKTKKDRESEWKEVDWVMDKGVKETYRPMYAYYESYRQAAIKPEIKRHQEEVDQWNQQNPNNKKTYKPDYKFDDEFGHIGTGHGMVYSAMNAEKIIKAIYDGGKGIGDWNNKRKPYTTRYGGRNTAQKSALKVGRYSSSLTADVIKYSEHFGAAIGTATASVGDIFSPVSAVYYTSDNAKGFYNARKQQKAVERALGIEPMSETLKEALKYTKNKSRRKQKRASVNAVGYGLELAGKIVSASGVGAPVGAALVISGRILTSLMSAWQTVNYFKKKYQDVIEYSQKTGKNYGKIKRLWKTLTRTKKTQQAKIKAWNSKMGDDPNYKITSAFGKRKMMAARLVNEIIGFYQSNEETNAKALLNVLNITDLWARTFGKQGDGLIPMLKKIAKGHGNDGGYDTAEKEKEAKDAIIKIATDKLKSTT